MLCNNKTAILHASSTTYTVAFPRPLVVDCEHAGAKTTAQNREEDAYNKAHYNMLYEQQKNAQIRRKLAQTFPFRGRFRASESMESLFVGSLFVIMRIIWGTVGSSLENEMPATVRAKCSWLSPPEYRRLSTASEKPLMSLTLPIAIEILGKESNVITADCVMFGLWFNNLAKAFVKSFSSSKFSAPTNVEESST